MFISKKEKKDLEQRCIILDGEVRDLKNIIRLLLEHLKLEIDDIPSSPSKRVLVKNGTKKHHTNPYNNYLRGTYAKSVLMSQLANRLRDAIWGR